MPEEIQSQSRGIRKIIFGAGGLSLIAITLVSSVSGFFVYCEGFSDLPEAPQNVMEAVKNGGRKYSWLQVWLAAWSIGTIRLPR